MKQTWSVAVVAAVCVLSAAAGPSTAPSTQPGYQNLTVEQFEAIAAKPDTVLLDVRTAEEFARGHPPGAINIDVNGPDFEGKVAALPKDKTYLVSCATGRRSRTACAKLSEMRFNKLYNLDGGFKAWEAAGKKVEK